MFKIGDVVVCVDASPPQVGGAMIRLRLRHVYRISDVHSHGTVLVNDEPPHVTGRRWGGWCSSRFRHLPKADNNFTASMRALRPLKVEETNS